MCLTIRNEHVHNQPILFGTEKDAQSYINKNYTKHIIKDDMVGYKQGHLKIKVHRSQFDWTKKSKNVAQDMFNNVGYSFLEAWGYDNNNEKLILQSKYQDYHYEEGIYYYQTPKYGWENAFYWDKGIFKFKTHDTFKGFVIDIHDGLHCWDSMGKIHNKDSDWGKGEIGYDAIIKVRIPAGSVVFEGVNGDIVADNMIVDAREANIFFRGGWKTWEGCIRQMKLELRRVMHTVIVCGKL